MAERSGFPPDYKEYFDGWVNELNQSGWGKKYQKAREEGVSEELIFEYQLDYARELLNDCNYNDKKTINEILDYVKYMVDTYVRNERVRELITEGQTTPRMWEYITAYYGE